MTKTLYLIDGVQVSEATFKLRQEFGEYSGAKFEAIAPPPVKKARR
jgi:hypothetical protein